ncbi:GNAT family N-acetyltransferase [Streptomyces sp. NPDC059740]|uniref:GNAT family N-acetyltransferase n=1 Tax=Streptomyces sp. NPDC059740 TaxID=3346926 RepID=UPI003663C61F
MRDVTPHDVDAYVRMRCDPVMMTHLGGPLPREGMEGKVARDAGEAAADVSWIRMIVSDGTTAGTTPGTVVGGVSLWSSQLHDEPVSEIAWMVLPPFQGRGVAGAFVRALLAEAAQDGRWGTVHALPAVGNPGSNGVCRSVGFDLLGETDLLWAGRPLRVNHWTVDPAAVDAAR